MFTPHFMTGVDKAHATGFNSKGIKIAIINTGIDSSLGGGFGPSHKVIGGYDFVGDACVPPPTLTRNQHSSMFFCDRRYDGTNTPAPDNNPMDNCNGHGTHVAGIIGANPGNAYKILGIAPSASILAYRIFGCKGTVTDNLIIKALLRSIDDQADIATLSLGSVDGWTSSSAAVVASRIASTGKVVTIAAGNDGNYGSWYTSSPGSGLDVISVASVEKCVAFSPR